MKRMNEIRHQYIEELGKFCQQNNISLTSMQKLLEAEKTKKLLKRNALIQQNIDREIENAIENEDN